MTATNDNPPRGHKSRDGNGKFSRTVEGAERDAEAARLHAQGLNYVEIGDHFGITRQAAMRAVQRAVREVVQDAGEEVLKLHINRLEYLYEKALEILEDDHILVSHGRIVTDDAGNTFPDTAPKLAAIREARATLESFRRLTGMDKPNKVEHSGGVTYELVGVDPQDLA
ncbi:helix-turn-helix domain-containing protein [Streptomyces misionensis]|uniref:helix-turn-helix domain-containing protein n=1 Tax=Streptomyces misionensis TaxID=67331 RepID=UPI0036C5E675